jgi:hypothetical protein
LYFSKKKLWPSNSEAFQTSVQDSSAISSLFLVSPPYDHNKVAEKIKIAVKNSFLTFSTTIIRRAFVHRAFPAVGNQKLDMFSV